MVQVESRRGLAVSQSVSSDPSSGRGDCRDLASVRVGSHLDGLEVLTAIERQVESLKTVHSFLAVADDGASWSEIGRRFGVTKQAA